MAYSGYRIKIDGTIFSNTDIAKGSYSLSKSKRVSKSWEDLTGIQHETYFPAERATITFSVREHSALDHQTLAAFFNSSSVTVQYWDDNANDYYEGTFKVEPFTWKHLTVESNGAFYGKTQITLKEW